MSVAAYVGRKVVRELRMPKGVSDGLGIRYDGAVLTGETTPEAKLRAEALRARPDSVTSICDLRDKFLNR